MRRSPRRVVVWACVWLCAATAVEAEAEAKTKVEAEAKVEADAEAKAKVETQAEADGELRCRPHSRCTLTSPDNDYSYYQFSIDGRTMSVNVEPSRLTVRCDRGTALDSEHLPAFTAPRTFASLTLDGCALPRGSLGAALAALNVAGGAARGLRLARLPREPPLGAAQLAGLPALRGLRLQSRAGAAAAPDVLLALPALRLLEADGVALPRAALAHLPPRLRRLLLQDATPAGALPELAALRELCELELYHSSGAAPATAQALVRAPSLRALTLEPAPELPPAAPRLRRLSLRRWTAARPGALPAMAPLRRLELFAPAAEALPPRWAAACPNLTELTIDFASRLAGLPRELLRGASSLTVLSIRSGILREIPEDLLHYTPELKELNLENNALQVLPSELFARSGVLARLMLASNALRSAAAVARAASLRSLSLARNRSLPPLCSCAPGGAGPSVLSPLTSLQQLELSETAASCVCSDWRTHMSALHTLDLRRTHITTLTRIDLEFDRSVESTVWLTGANVSSILFDRSDWEAPAPYPGSAAVSVQLDARRALACDCGMYWTWRALRAGAAPLARVRPLRCAGPAPRALAQLREDELLCPAAGRCGALPAACACAHNAALLRVSCAGAALSAPPAALARLATRLDLLLPRNNLSSLRAADLPPRIRKLDLHNNSLSTLDEETALRILNASEVYISGNPWECGCEAAAMLQLFRSHGGRLADYEAARCADGGALAAARTEPCREPERALLAAALALLLPALAAAAALRNAESRQLARALLDRLGLWPRAAEDDECAYDAFVSFAHEDSAYAAELVRRLEPAYRLCLHYRDWEPGRWIPEQIARSVRASRRTVALLSAHSLRSAWARAEVREALALALRSARPRLLAVLLDAPERLPLDAELRRYLARHTYVRWHDPWFPHKLRLALPRPRARSPPPPPLYSVPLPGDPFRKPDDKDDER